jgi:hypothetical protein
MYIEKNSIGKVSDINESDTRSCLLVIWLNSDGFYRIIIKYEHPIQIKKK